MGYRRFSAGCHFALELSRCLSEVTPQKRWAQHEALHGVFQWAVSIADRLPTKNGWGGAFVLEKEHCDFPWYRSQDREKPKHEYTFKTAKKFAVDVTQRAGTEAQIYRGMAPGPWWRNSAFTNPHPATDHTFTAMGSSAPATAGGGDE